MEVVAYTKGQGRMSCTLRGYEPCHNSEEIVEATGYCAKNDSDNPAGSIFCSHGTGFYVEWDEVEKHMHVERVLKEEKPEVKTETTPRSYTLTSSYGWGDEKEREEIFKRTYYLCVGGTKRALKGEYSGGQGQTDGYTQQLPRV